MSPVGRSDHTAAESIATTAGKLRLSVRASGKSGDQLKLAGDRASHEYILERLRVSSPQDDVEAVGITGSRSGLIGPRTSPTPSTASPASVPWPCRVAV